MSSESTRGNVIDRIWLRRFLHDVSTPLSAVSLHLEAAIRRAERGDDPSIALATARRELSRAFELFERGRQDALAIGQSEEGRSA
jgi:hypothetical protein